MIAHRSNLLAALLSVFLLGSGAYAGDDDTGSVIIRVMTFNLEDVRRADAMERGDERLGRLAAVIQRVRPNVLLLNEIETWQDAADESTAELFVRNYLMDPQEEGLAGIGFESYTPGTNTGIQSGYDLDRSGSIVGSVPEKSVRQTNEQRAYGGDCFGFGGFPGQYGMALLVDPRLTIDRDAIRTFQEFLWKDLPGASVPTNADGSVYYSEDAWAEFRLSSKTFADVPIALPNGAVLHALISHPTPPAFDGEEMRNRHRNRDEIRLIRAYIDGEDELYDDAGKSGGLEPGASFVILGDLNADPVDGSSLGDPIVEFLFGSDRVGEDPAPRSEVEIEGLDATDTSGFKLRVDYVLPSSEIGVIGTGVWRHGVKDEDGFGSDHFPVWADLRVPNR